eukprot:440406_1
MSKDVMSSKVLQLRHVFGFRSDISSPFHFLDEQNVVFSGGHNLIIHNIEDQSQQFISGQNHGSTLPTNGITAIDVFPAKKLIAVAERSEKGATIQIFELLSNQKRRRKVMASPDIQSREIISLQFSSDSKYLLALGGAPDWCIINYQREKGRIIQIIRCQTSNTQPFYSGSYCPSDPNLIVCSGHKVLKFYKSEQSELKPIAISLGKREPTDYTAHAWDGDKRLLIATEQAEILIFEGTEFRGAFDTLFTGPILSIITFAKGFVCGCDNGTILAYERGDGKGEMYTKLNKLWILKCTHGITHLSTPPSEEQLACVVANHEIYGVNLSQIEVLKEEDDEDTKEDKTFELLLPSFHAKTISGLDVCIRKSYLVSSGYDRSVRVWNWHEKRMLISRRFAEDPLCVAMHPSGLHIVVGFADKLRLMNILMDDIRGYKEFSIKGCTEVKFSNGGQYFAAINASAVQIYEMYTFDNIATLRGHTAKVTSLWWLHDDSKLVTSSADNSVLVWNINSNSRSQEHQHKGCSYTAAVLDNKQLLYCCGSDDTIKIISDGKVRKSIDVPVRLSSLELQQSGDQNWLFAATGAGYLMLFDTKNVDSEWVEVQAHAQCITRMRISWDDSMLVTASQDGCICIFDIDTRNQQQMDQQQLSWAEEILVSRSDLESKLSQIERLRHNVEDLRLHNECEIRMKEMNYQDKLKKVNDKFEAELDGDKSKYNALRCARDEMQNKYEDTLCTLAQKHDENLAEVEHYHKLKITAEKQRFGDLNAKLDTLAKQWNQDKSQRDTQYAGQLNDLQSKYEAKIAKEKEEIESIWTQIEKLRREFEEMCVLLEQDADRELYELKEKYDSILKTERTQTLELRGNNGMLKREFAQLSKRIKDGNDVMQASLEEQNKLIEEIRRFEKDIDGYEREIGERDSTISEKNKMICEVEKKNQELEKFKFVLDYKIHELDRQIKPREVQITEINKQMHEMNAESNKYMSNNHYLSLRVKDLKLKSQALQHEHEQQMNRNGQVLGLIRVIAHQLSICNTNKGLKKNIVQLHQQFRELDLDDTTPSQETAQTDSGSGNGNGMASVHEEFQRHRNYLQRTVQGLEKQLVKDATVFNKDSTRIMQENVALIKEINELRKEINCAQKDKNKNNLKKEIKENEKTIHKLMHIKESLLAVNVQAD